MNQSILQILIDQALTPPPAELLTLCGDYYAPYYHFFLLAARQLGRGLLVELGVDQGRGLAALALSKLPVVGVDHTRTVGLNTILPIFDNITFLKQDSLPVPVYFSGGGLPDYFPAGQISLLHIDTEHSYAQAKNEFEAYRPYLTNPALVVFDDLHAQEDSVLEYFDSLTYPKIQADPLHPTCGWGVIIYEADDAATQTLSDPAD